MTDKFIDLVDRVARETETHKLFVSRVLRWLDEHPNPTVEPSNTERLAMLMSHAAKAHVPNPWVEVGESFNELAEALDAVGVTAPEGDTP